jgi:hypothetical protein
MRKEGVFGLKEKDRWKFREAFKRCIQEKPHNLTNMVIISLLLQNLNNYCQIQNFKCCEDVKKLDKNVYWISQQASELEHSPTLSIVR